MKTNANLKSGERRRLVLLSSLLVVCIGAYVYWQFFPQTVTPSPAPAVKSPTPSTPVAKIQKSQADKLPLDEKTKAKLMDLMGDFEFDPQKHTLKYAIHLDHGVGRKQMAQGKYRETYETYRQVLGISYHVNSLRGIEIALGMISILYHRMNRSSEGTQALMLAYRIAKQGDTPEEYGLMELSIANHLRTQDRSLAMAWLLRARENLRGTQYREDYVRLLSTLAEELRWLGRPGAGDVYKDAWTKAQTLGNAVGQKWTKLELALDYSNYLQTQSRYQEALDVLLKASAWIDDAERNSESAITIMFRLANLYTTLGEQKQAERYFLSGYTAHELLRLKAPGEEGRAKLDQNYKSHIDNYIQFYLQQNRLEDALVLLEANKARTLNDIIAESGYRERYAQWTEMQRKQTEARWALMQKDDLDAWVDAEKTFDDFMTLNESQAKKRKALKTALQLSELTTADAYSKQQLVSMRKRLPADVALVSFFISSETSGAFVVTRDKLKWLPFASKTPVYKRATLRWQLALSNDGTDFYRTLAAFFQTELMTPIIQQLPASVSTIVYSSDGFVHRLALDALLSDQHYLVEKYAFLRIPSFRYLDDFQTLSHAGITAGISCTDPAIDGARLPFQSDTGRFLDTLYSQHQGLTGVSCTAEKLVDALQSLKQPGFLHVGAHGQFYSGDPMESAIYLTDDTNPGNTAAWDVRAIATADLSNIDLVTLSSCETGVLARSRKRDIFGILRGFYYAGAKQVIAPLWSVHDRATAEFMKKFYTIYNQGRSPALALQEVKQAFIKDERYSHPFYWSGFVLFGAQL